MKAPEAILEILANWAEQKRSALRYHEALSDEDLKLLAAYAWLELQALAERQQVANVVAQIAALPIRNLGVITAFEIVIALRQFMTSKSPT